MADDSAPNEILETVAAHKAHEHAGANRAAAQARAKRWNIGRIVGVGIGSAAVAAAVLFANNQRRD